MPYYAHTAEDGEDRQLPQKHWQPLTEHLCNVAKLAKQFAEPLEFAAEAELTGLLHGLKPGQHSQKRGNNDEQIHRQT